MSAFGPERLERPVVVGFGATAIGRHDDRTPSDLGLEALEQALDGCGVAPRELEGLYGELAIGQAVRVEPRDEPETGMTLLAVRVG